MIQILKLPKLGVEELTSTFLKRRISFDLKKIPLGSNNPLIKPKKVAKIMKRKLKCIKPVVFNGVGDYHHLTYGICSLFRVPFGYIHFDRHSDLGDRNLKYICGRVC